MDFKQDTVDQLQPTLEIVAITSIIISAILLLACLKWSKLADYIVYEQMNYQLLLAFLPSDKNNYYDMYSLQVSFQGFIFTYTDSRAQIIYLCVNQLCWVFLPQYTIYKDPLTPNALTVKISIVFATFVCLSLFAMLLMYIAQLHRRMKNLNCENVKMLDGMHEGLLIVQKSTTNSMRTLTNDIMFCNRSAEKLLTNLIQFWRNSNTH